MHKIKTNEKSKKNVRKNIKKNEVIEESEVSLKNIAIVVGVIAVIFVLFYLLTAVILKNKKDKKTEKTDYSDATLLESSSDILMSDILKQTGDKYYVIAILDDKTELYNLYLYNRTDFYYVNMDNALNKTIIADETVYDEDPRNIRISDTTLFVVENNQIAEYYVGYNDVITFLRGV